MPVLPQFSPAAGPGAIPAAVNAGITTGMSMMERGQVARLREEQMAQIKIDRARQEAEDRIKAPVMEAKAKADLVAFDTQVRGMRDAEETRAAAEGILPEARVAFDQIMLMAEPEDREMLAMEWVGRYGQLSGVAAYADEFKTKKDLIGQIVTESSAIRAMKARTAEEREIIAARGAVNKDLITTRADAAPPRDKATRYQLLQRQAREDGDAEAEELYTNLLAKEQSASISSALGSEQVRERLDQARAGGDPEEVSFWEQRTTALNRRGVKQDDFANKLATAAAALGIPAPAAATTPAPAPAPAATPPPNPQTTPPARVQSKQEFDALPSGARYIGPDGKLYQKP